MPDKFEMIKSPKRAVKVFRKVRWQGKIYCPYCACVNDIRSHSVMRSGLKRYFCDNCEKTFSDTTGTIFSKSRIPIWKWMYVLIILLQSTGSISAAEVSRGINVSYPTAWKMMKKIRDSFRYDSLKGQLKGVVESDEAWFSKKDNQTILLGIVEREGAVKFFEIFDRTETSLWFPHRKYVQEGSMVCTDGHASYGALSIRFIHHWVNHSIGEFAWRDIHSNTIEGVWSMLKGIIRTIHHGVSKRHFLSYAQLFAFHYSNRYLNHAQQFNLLFKKICQPRYCLY